jgi:hypothetical protein
MVSSSTTTINTTTRLHAGLMPLLLTPAAAHPLTSQHMLLASGWCHCS